MDLLGRRMRRRAAYQRTFCGDRATPHLDGESVLADLRKFARIEEGGLVVSPVTRTTDSHASMYRAGLRDMYLRIVAHLGIEESQAFTQHEEKPDESAHT
jgi:hypothetical protein